MKLNQAAFWLVTGLFSFTVHAANLVNTEVETRTLGGVPYYEVRGDFEDTITRPDGSEGTFSVPLNALVPHGTCNNTAIVDLLNSGLFELPKTPLDHVTLDFGRMFLGDDLIAGRGYGAGFTYVGVQWNKTVTDATGDGKIERATDGYRIFSSLSRRLRDGTLFWGEIPEEPCHIAYVLGFGWSQTGKLLAGMLTNKLNGSYHHPVFDGLFLGAAGGICRSLEDGTYAWSYQFCQEAPRHHVPVVAFNTQSDVELAFGDGALRQPKRNLTVYDFAGLAHIDAQFLPFRRIFDGFEFRQNPVSVFPAVRASFWNLYLQVRHRISPAKSRLISSASSEEKPVSFTDIRGDSSLLTWSGGPVRALTKDSDGNATGGVRYPHMPVTYTNHNVSRMGAPLGRYRGIDFNYAQGTGVVFANGGAFEPFSQQQLTSMYPAREDYLRKIRASVFHLIFMRYLLVEDGVAMIEEAETLALPHWK